MSIINQPNLINIDNIIKLIEKGNLEHLKKTVARLPKSEISANLSLWNKDLRTPLYKALIGKDIECLRYLLQGCNVDPYKVIKENMTLPFWVLKELNPLTVAVRTGLLIMVQMMLEYVPYPNFLVESDHAVYPLKVALECQNFPIADYLNNNGLKISRSTLCFAMDRGNLVVIKYVLDHIQDINMQFSPGGETVLHFCCSNGSSEVLKIVLERGAKHLQDENGLKPIDMAVKCQKGHIVLYLLNNGYEPREEAFKCIEGFAARHITCEPAYVIRIWNLAAIESQKGQNSIFPIEHIDSDILKDKDILKVFIIKRLANYFRGKKSSFISQYNINIDYHHNNLNIINLTSEFWKIILIAIRDIYGEDLKMYLTNCEIAFSHYLKLFLNYIMLERNHGIDESVYKTMWDFQNGIKQIPMQCSDFQCIVSSQALFTILLKLIQLNGVLYAIKDELPIEHQQSLKENLYQILQMNEFKKMGTSPIHVIIDHQFSVDWPHFISEESFLDFLDYCIKMFGFVNYLDAQGNTPLHKALMLNSNKMIIEIFLRNGALTEIKNNKGESIRYWAIKRGLQDIMPRIPSFKFLCEDVILNNVETDKMHSLIKNYHHSQ